MATITDAGLAVKTLQEYLEQVRESYRDIDGAWNIEPESPDGQVIAVWSELFANLDEGLAAAYASVDPTTAVGTQLDRIARISGLTRKAGTFSTATVTFTGSDGITIPAGTGVRNSDTGTVFETETSVTVDAGKATVNVTATVRGPESAGIGDLNEIADPVSGISSVTNDNAASLGKAPETDAALRIRRSLSVGSPGSNQASATFGKIANLDDVNNVRIYENRTSSVDGNGLEPHSLAIFVDGGDTVEIAEAIAKTKAPGCGLNDANSFANKVQEDVFTEFDNAFTATFYRPELTTIFVEVTVDGDLSQTTIDNLKQAIVDYSKAELFSAGIEGFDKTGFGIGEVLPAGKLYTPANRAIESDGFVTSILIGEDSGSVNQSSVDPGFNGFGVFDFNNISVILA